MAQWGHDSGHGEVRLLELGEHRRMGQPLGNPAFVERLDRMVGRVLRPQKGRWGEGPQVTKMSIVSPELSPGIVHAGRIVLY